MNEDVFAFCQGAFFNLEVDSVANVKLAILSLGWSAGLVCDFPLESAHLGRKHRLFYLTPRVSLVALVTLNGVNQGLADFGHKGPGSKYFGFVG